MNLFFKKTPVKAARMRLYATILLHEDHILSLHGIS